MKKSRLIEDPVVAEVRTARSAIWEEAGGSMAKLQRWLDAESSARHRQQPPKQRRRTKPK